MYAWFTMIHEQEKSVINNPQGACLHLMGTEIIRRTLKLRLRGIKTYGREERTWIADAPVGQPSTRSLANQTTASNRKKTTYVFFLH